MSELRKRCKQVLDGLVDEIGYNEDGGFIDTNEDECLALLEYFATSEAERAVQDFIHGRDKLCLNCGAKEPCSLKDSPQSPCTFDPTPKELLHALRKQNIAERIKGMEAARNIVGAWRESDIPEDMSMGLWKWVGKALDKKANEIDAEIKKLKEGHGTTS